ncbi:MAG: hypothetical protein ACTSRE_14810 [Promethearchaeota archaeon]
MDSNKEHQKEYWITFLKFGLPIVLGIIALITSTLLDMADVFPYTPSLVFKILNGIFIAVIIVFGFIWSQMEKKLKSEFKKTAEE